jgi:3-oxoacyl-[acyl-carrier protein] reductase
MQLKGQVALITGGGRGIGRAIAERFAREGAAVALASRTEAELEATRETIRRAGGRAACFPGDVSQEAFVTRLVDETRQQLGEIGVLVNNAGIYGPLKPIYELATEDWDRVLSINLRGAFLLTRAVLPGMVQRGRGVVLNISSDSGKHAYPLSGGYAVSKAGLIALTRAAAADVSRQGVRVNALCPGPVKGTRMWEELGAGLQQAFQLIAAAALFLCSEEASAITGQAVNVDGGTVFY